MTEAEWLASNHPAPMVAEVIRRTSHRKLRLFAAGCCRLVADLLVVSASHHAIAVAERYADGVASAADLSKAGRAVRRDTPGEPRAGFTAEGAVETACDTDVNKALHAVGLAAWAEAVDAHGSVPAARSAGLAAACLRQVPIAHCVFGNPFRPVAFAPGWLTPTVTALAAGVYADRAFDRLPVLADALEDAGCDAADVLAHCRGPGPHVRGCWVVDGVLGRR